MQTMLDSTPIGGSYVQPFSYFGGKARAAAAVWQRFGDVRVYFEPFAGGLGCLLNRPVPIVGQEYVNDKDGLLSNAWRCLRRNPDGLIDYLREPPVECDLHAVHKWLISNRPGLAERLESDPEWYDVKLAGRWLWGIALWLGGGWCDRAHRSMIAVHGSGTFRVSHRVNGVRLHLPDYLAALSRRLARVVVDCGEWKRSVCYARMLYALQHRLPVGVLLDPPYHARSGRNKSLYACEDLAISGDVREWAIEKGQDPLMRIAVCGFEGEHEFPLDWECFAWSSSGGMGRNGRRSLSDRHRERIWFSPGCLRQAGSNGNGHGKARDLFGEVE